MRVLAITAAAAMAASALAGCASLPTLTPTAVDQRSPVAGRIAAEGAVTRRYPTFADIPPTPRDVRTVAQYDETVGAVRGQGTALSDWERANPAMNTGTEAFAAAARAEVDQAGGPVTAAERARTEAYAAEQRRRAEPPPPPE